MCSGFWNHVDLVLVLNKHTVSIFRAGVAMLGIGGIYEWLKDRKVEEVGQLGTRNYGGKFQANRVTQSGHLPLQA